MYKRQILAGSFGSQRAIVQTLTQATPLIFTGLALSLIHIYGVSSCYNILPIRGGAYTLPRVTLTRLVDDARGVAVSYTHLNFDDGQHTIPS